MILQVEWMLTIALICLFIGSYRSFSHLHDACDEKKKFVAITPNDQRLGNQLFHLVSGYGIAKKIGRTLYYPLRPGRNKRVRKYLQLIAKAFPKTAYIYKIISLYGVKQTWVKFATDKNFFRACCRYEDPTRLIGHPAKFLLLDFKFAQNAQYFEEYLQEVRELFQFSDEAKRQGEFDLASLKIGNAPDFFCVHTRRTDFVMYGVESNANGTARAVIYLAELQGLDKILMFGDDRDFMDSLTKMIVDGTGIKDVYISSFSEISEFYISSRVCKSFLLSAASSTFGWWLAFFAREQNAVYYYKDGRATDDFKLTHDEFQLWVQL